MIFCSDLYLVPCCYAGRRRTLQREGMSFPRGAARQRSQGRERSDAEGESYLGAHATLHVCFGVPLHCALYKGIPGMELGQRIKTSILGSEEAKTGLATLVPPSYTYSFRTAGSASVAQSGRASLL